MKNETSPMFDKTNICTVIAYENQTEVLYIEPPEIGKIGCI